MDRLAFENHTKCDCRPRPPALSPIDLSNDQPDQNQRAQANSITHPRGSPNPTPAPTQIPTPVEQDDIVQPTPPRQSFQSEKGNFDKGGRNNLIRETNKSKANSGSPKTNHPKNSSRQKNSEVTHQTFERSQSKVLEQSSNDPKQQTYRRSANLPSSSHPSVSTVPSSTKSSEASVHSIPPYGEPENLPAPSKLERKK